MSQEVDIPSGVADLPEGLALMKIETESIMAVAARRPRKSEAIVAGLKEQVRLFPEFAERAIYTRPVGKDEHGKQKYATGLSIRAAEAIAEAYGGNSVRSTVTMVNPDLASVEAVFVDYQNLRKWSKNILVSRKQKRKDGSFYMLADERFQLLCDAKSSIAIREVILRSVPPGLRAALEAEVRTILRSRLDPERVQKIVAAFGARGVSLPQLEGFLDNTPAAAWTNDERMRLLELDTALRDGETTVEEAFGSPAPVEKAAEAPTTGGRVLEKLQQKDGAG